MNFSKAHELGHWILHFTKLNEHKQMTFLSTEVFQCRNVIKRNPREVQAHLFAVLLLMPKEIISKAVHELKKKGYVTFLGPYIWQMTLMFQFQL